MYQLKLTLRIGISIISLLAISTHICQGQQSKAWFSIGYQNFEAEVEKDNGAYRVTLTNKRINPNITKSQKTNYLNKVNFKRIIFELYNQIEAEDQNKEVNEITLDSTIQSDADRAIDGAFLEIITTLYNVEASGQKIGKITLKNKVTILENTLNTKQSEGSKKALRKQGSSRWQRKQRLKKKRNLWKSIKELNKKKIQEIETWSDQDSLQLLQYQATLSRLDKPESATAVNPKLTETLDIDMARLTFEDGSIKEITVRGTNGDSLEIYSNKFSIGASTRKNIQDFDRISLYQEVHNGKFSRNKKIKLSDVITIERILGLRTNDYSPADVRIELEPGKPQELFKAPSSQIFNLNVFSDLIGFDEDNPNGLVQFELSKRINLGNRRSDALFPRNMGFSTFSHLIPVFEITKVEENNRNIGFSEFNGTSYLSPLELYRFSTARTTNELNIIDLQGGSLSFHFNFVSGINITRLNDTIGSGATAEAFNQNINSLLLGGSVKAIFNPEFRWAFQVTSRWTYLDPLNSNVTFRSLENNQLRGPNYLINSWEFLATWRTGPDTNDSQNKLFARYRFNHEWDYWNNNFSELQIGYSIFLKSTQENKD